MTGRSELMDAVHPGGPGGTVGGGDSQLMQQALAYAQCMRDHGVTSYPDPKQSGNTVTMGAFGLDPNDPSFHAAQQACQSLVPGSDRASGTGAASAQPDGSSQP